jgi:hypothetical protein
VDGTDLIQRDGNVYTFTGDIFGTITVEKDGIIIDGAGYAIKGNGTVIDLRKNPAANAAIPSGYGDVVVKNVRFCDKSRIFATSNGNRFINNIFEGGGIDIKGGFSGEGLVIKCNVFIDGRPAISADYADGVVVAENDFINCRIARFIYGILDFNRNYWSDYKTLYPDAKEVGRTGIWDTPYHYDKNDWSDQPFVDYNPVVNPTNGTGAPPGINETPTPTVPTPSVPTTSNSPVPTTSNSPVPTTSGGNGSESFPTALLIAVGIVCVVIASISLLVYFKKRKQLV